MRRSSVDRLRSTISYFAELLASKTQRRFAFRWLRSLNKDYLFTTPSPWMTFDAIEYLQSHIRPGWRVFEYGSGGSTLFWLHLGAECVSIEHDKEWYSIVSGYIGERAQADYRLVLPELLTTAQDDADPSDPAQYLSSSLPGYSFKNYVTQIDTFPDQYFDVIVVDGRSRPSCLVHSIPKLKTGGLLVLDNADRKYYLEQTQPVLKGFLERKFIGAIPGLRWFVQTNIYEKQESG